MNRGSSSEDSSFIGADPSEWLVLWRIRLVFPFFFSVPLKRHEKVTPQEWVDSGVSHLWGLLELCQAGLCGPSASRGVAGIHDSRCSFRMRRSPSFSLFSLPVSLSLPLFLCWPCVNPNCHHKTSPGPSSHNPALHRRVSIRSSRGLCMLGRTLSTLVLEAVLSSEKSVQNWVFFFRLYLHELTLSYLRGLGATTRLKLWLGESSSLWVFGLFREKTKFCESCQQKRLFEYKVQILRLMPT